MSETQVTHGKFTLNRLFNIVSRTLRRNKVFLCYLGLQAVIKSGRYILHRLLIKLARDAASQREKFPGFYL